MFLLAVTLHYRQQNNTPTLAQVGITKMQSSRFQKLADISETRPSIELKKQRQNITEKTTATTFGSWAVLIFSAENEGGFRAALFICRKLTVACSVFRRHAEGCAFLQSGELPK
jgi:hypothetical protein